MDLVKSKSRVANHGEVFTPRWLVDQMLDTVGRETVRIDARFLEPACGSGNFLVPILERKLVVARKKYAKSEFELIHQALFALMCVYGIELLPDNVAECRSGLVAALMTHVKTRDPQLLERAAESVVGQNIVHGDALDMTTPEGKGILFPEWAYLGQGKFQRRDFRFQTLSQMSSFDSDTLFANSGHEIFVPAVIHPPFSIEELAE